MALAAGLPPSGQWVIWAGAFCLLALLLQILWTSHRPHRQILAARAGEPWQGVLYAFTLGMLPGAKESARRHLPTYLAGIVYHLGVFAALLLLAAALLGTALAPALRLAAAALASAGLLSGFGLLVKRTVNPGLARLSVPDDYVSNLLVDLFLGLTLLAGWSESWTSWWYGSASLLFLYIPFGKIRHCAYFFYARTVFGLSSGRRGIFPPPEGRAQS